MAELAQDAIKNDQRLLRVKDAGTVVQPYLKTFDEEYQKTLFTAITWRHGGYGWTHSLSLALSPPKTWRDMAGFFLLGGVEWYETNFGVGNKDALKQKVAEAIFSRDEQLALSLRAKTLTQNWPKDLEARSSRSRGHRANRGRN